MIGELLKLNDVNLEEMLREAAYNPKDIATYLDQIERIDAERLKEYEKATGLRSRRATSTCHACAARTGAPRSAG